MSIDEIITKLRKNECLILPSDTLYGIAARAYSLEAVQKVFAIKNRPNEKKLPIHYASLTQIEKDIVITDLFDRLAKKFWPGKLTIVAKLKPNAKLQCLEETAAVRIPNHQILLETISKLGEPITMPSANLHTHAEIHQFDEITKILKLDGIKDDVNISKSASTIIDITSGTVKILRIGDITEEHLKEFFD